MGEKLTSGWIRVKEEALVDKYHRTLTDNELQMKVNHFITNDKKWDIKRLTSAIGTRVAEEIKRIPIPCNDMEDELCLGETVNGIFLVKSATWLAYGSRNEQHENCDFNWIWKLYIQPKIKIFMWHVWLQALPVRDILRRR